MINRMAAALVAATIVLSACGGGGDSEPEATAKSDAHCSALKEVRYRYIPLTPSNLTDPNAEFDWISVEDMDLSGSRPVSRVVNKPDAAGSELAPVPNEACHYTSGPADVLVAPSGVIVYRRALYASSPTLLSLVVGLPVQDEISLSDLAGEWTALGSVLLTHGVSNPVAISSGSTGTGTAAAQPASLATGGDTTVTLHAGQALQLGLNRAGQVFIRDCYPEPLHLGTLAGSDASCEYKGQELGALSRHSQGGFTLTVVDLNGSAALKKWRVFAYRAPSGSMMLMAMSAMGEVTFMTPAQALKAPAIGNRSHTADILMSGQIGLPVVDILDSDFTVTDVDPINDVIVRSGAYRSSTHKVTSTTDYDVQLNAPFAGMTWRQSAAGSVFSLPLRGMNMSFAALPQADAIGSTIFALSVDKVESP
jgi:hypothetical protein